MIVYSNYKKRKEDDDACKRAFGTFDQSSGIFGIKLKKPLFMKV